MRQDETWTMRSTTSLLFIAVFGCLSGCLNSYSKIDSRNWQAFEENLPVGRATYSVPGGFVAGRAASLKHAQLLRSFGYDVLSGPYVYGDWPETTVDVFLSTSAPESLEDFIDGFSTSARPDEDRVFSEDWQLLVFNGDHSMGRWYINRLENGQLLIVRAFLLDAVYDSEELRRSRIQLVEDVVGTFRIHKK